MSTLHTSQNLFLETQELARLQRFLGVDGLEALATRLTGQPGLLLGATGSGWRVAVDDLSLRTLRVGAGYAVDGRGRVLHLPELTALTLPVGEQWYWLRVSYRQSALEQGYCTVSADGTVTGVGTAFGETLRGQPNYPSRLRFFSSEGVPAALNGTQEHEVLDVLDATTIRLSTIGLQNEAGLRYAVVGTFLPGFIPEIADKYPFRYDSALLQIVPETSGNTPPALATGQTPDDAFYIARVKRDDTTVYIDDKRNQQWLTTAQLEARTLPSKPHPFYGVERITFDTVTSPRDRNYVTVGWGFRATGWAFDPGQLTLTLTVGAGGKYLTPADVQAGDFDGWNLYLPGDPEPIAILSSIKPSASAGQTVVLTLPQADPVRFAAAANKGLVIVPNVEGILVRGIPVGTQDVAGYEFEFSPALGRGRFPLPVTGPSQLYQFEYAYRTGTRTTGWRGATGMKYYAEANFSDQGTFKSGITPTRTPVSGSRATLQQAPDALQKFRDQTTTGDLFGVEFRTIETATQVIDEVIGTNAQYQVIQTALAGPVPGSLTLTQDQFVNLKGVGASNTQLRSGNHFTLHFKGTLDLDGHEFRIVKDYVDNANVGTVLKTFTTEELLQMGKPEGLLVSATWHQPSASWIIYTFAAGGSGDLGELKLLGQRPGYDPRTLFDASTGLGFDTGRYAGWALCDGRNGTDDMRRRVPVGYDPDADSATLDSVGQRTQAGDLVENYGALGNIGGETGVALAKAEIPKHVHGVGTLALANAGAHSHSTNAPSKNSESTEDGSGQHVQREDSGDATTSTNGEHTHTINGSTEDGTATGLGLNGAVRTHENRMPYRVILYAQKIA